MRLFKSDKEAEQFIAWVVFDLTNNKHFPKEEPEFPRPNVPKFVTDWFEEEKLKYRKNVPSVAQLLGLQ